MVNYKVTEIFTMANFTKWNNSQYKMYFIKKKHLILMKNKFSLHHFCMALFCCQRAKNVFNDFLTNICFQQRGPKDAQ